MSATAPLPSTSSTGAGPAALAAVEWAAAWPVQGFLRHFWHEFEYAIVNKRFYVDDERAGTLVGVALDPSLVTFAALRVQARRCGELGEGRDAHVVELAHGARSEAVAARLVARKALLFNCKDSVTALCEPAAGVSSVRYRAAVLGGQVDETR